MTPLRQESSAAELRQLISGLSERGPITQAFENGRYSGRAWYRSQKEHWLGWLHEYEGPGAYGRDTHAGRSAKFIYNHVVCPPMALWLAEAAGVERHRLLEAVAVAEASGPKPMAQVGAVRRVLPWSLVEAGLNGKQKLGRVPLRPQLRWLPNFRRI